MHIRAPLQGIDPVDSSEAFFGSLQNEIKVGAEDTIVKVESAQGAMCHVTFPGRVRTVSKDWNFFGSEFPRVGKMSKLRCLTNRE
jgi:hypothetical protein